MDEQHRMEEQLREIEAMVRLVLLTNRNCQPISRALEEILEAVVRERRAQPAGT